VDTPTIQVLLDQVCMKVQPAVKFSVKGPQNFRHLVPLSLQASTATRSLLVHLKSTSRDGGLVTQLVEGLTLLYDQAQELHGDEDALAAAGGPGQPI
jgi:hypothetical protein